MAKRRRLNGSLEEAMPLGDPAPVGFDRPPASIGDDPPPALVTGTERTEMMDLPVPRPPPPHLNAAPLPPDPPGRGGPPEAIPIGNASLASPDALPTTPIELRIRRLEDALAQLQVIRAAEMRVITAQSARPAIPVATPVVSPAPEAPTDKLWELGKRVLTAPAEAARSFSSPPGDPRSRHGWLFFDCITEARAIVRMFTDPRYRLSWASRIAPAALTFLIVVSWWWVPFTSIPIFGNILDKAIDLVLAFALFKFLGHEARRYRETAPDLPPSLRL